MIPVYEVQLKEEKIIFFTCSLVLADFSSAAIFFTSASSFSTVAASDSLFSAFNFLISSLAFFSRALLLQSLDLRFVGLLLQRGNEGLDFGLFGFQHSRFLFALGNQRCLQIKSGTFHKGD
ncbi:hypothetical protein TYRP_014606 [Tyrophagus putrescentiae]|nr:hypothetical protein TYRP_014606 [Tyrophagus putrescentiae]